MHPQDLGTRLLRASTGLRDCYTETDAFHVRLTPALTSGRGVNHFLFAGV